MNRRSLLLGATALGMAGCGIVTTTTTNGVTTITINVAKINQYAQAFASAVATVLGVPGVAVLLGPYLTPFQAIAGAVVQDIAAFNTATNGAAVLTYDSTSIPSAVTSVLNDGKSILSTISQALPQTAIVGTLMSAVNAVQTIVMLFEALLPTVAASRAAIPPPMTEAQALAVLGVH